MLGLGVLGTEQEGEKVRLKLPEPISHSASS